MEKGLALLCGNDIPSELIFKPIAQIAGCGESVFVVDGENSFRSYLIARYARAMNLDPRLTLANVHISRAFTCYQLVETVSRLNCRTDATDGAGIVCLGLLETFCDEDITLPEAQRLLRDVSAHLKSLADRFLVLVTVRPPRSKARNRLVLIQALAHGADAVRIVPSHPQSQLPAQIPLTLKSGR